jgi:hypothetical protein
MVLHSDGDIQKIIDEARKKVTDIKDLPSLADEIFRILNKGGYTGGWQSIRNVLNESRQNIMIRKLKSLAVKHKWDPHSIGK